MHWSPNVVLVQKLPQLCSECGMACQKCVRNSSVALEQELEKVKLELADSYSRMLVMEEEFASARKSVEIENIRLFGELEDLQERHKRVLESQKKFQKLNDTLETKLLNVVERYEQDKNKLNQYISSITSQLLDARVIICDLEEDLKRCRSDCNIAVQLLRCRPSQFVEHKLDTLPADIQERLGTASTTLSSECRRRSKITQQSVPPTPIVYAVNQSNTGSSVPLTAIAHVLTQPSLKPRPGRLVICSQCHVNRTVSDQLVQTESDCDSASQVMASTRSKQRRTDKMSVETKI